MKTLSIVNIHAETTDGKKILNGVTLTIKQGEIHAIMGPNGGGKSTLAQVLMGHPGYKITQGTISLDSEDITHLPPDRRAHLGLFLGFQYPVEVAGVNFANFLRLAINEKKNAGEKKISPLAFRKILTSESTMLSFNEDLSKRTLNEGFSGGEKKKAEVLQLAIMKPDFAILDEPDSGLDVDALKYIAKSINSFTFHPGVLLITHYQRILHYIHPDFVHVMVKGRLVQSGDATLAKHIENSGYEQYLPNN